MDPFLILQILGATTIGLFGGLFVLPLLQALGLVRCSCELPQRRDGLAEAHPAATEAPVAP